MNEDKSNDIFIFPKWTWVLRPAVAVGALGGLFYATIVVAFGFSPLATDVGYAPEQPVPYSHALHVGQLGMDCRYCHTGVETTAFATIPPTQTCMNCHKAVRANSEKLIPVFESYSTGMPVEWIRVHDLPDYVYFNHSAHVNKGIGCVSCHGPVDEMPLTWRENTLHMAWCLDCHRNPEKFVRPRDKVFDMTWEPEGDQEMLGAQLVEAYDIHTLQSCSVCHR